jgi:hypothetical protein
VKVISQHVRMRATVMCPALPNADVVMLLYSSMSDSLRRIGRYALAKMTGSCLGGISKSSSIARMLDSAHEAHGQYSPSSTLKLFEVVPLLGGGMEDDSDIMA